MARVSDNIRPSARNQGGGLCDVAFQSAAAGRVNTVRCSNFSPTEILILAGVAATPI
jgi:hypothetical protein